MLSLAYQGPSGAAGTESQLELCTHSYCESYRKVSGFSKSSIAQENSRTTDGNQGKES